MGRSILEQNQNHCFFCGTCSHLEQHHIFNGNPNRSLSDKYKLTITLCHQCHNEPPSGVHFNKYRMAWLKNYAQRKAMETYGWDTDTFIKIFGKNYLIETEDFLND